MTPDEAVARALPGAQVARITPLNGGDLSEVIRADLADGRSVVVKRGPLVAAEARMLTTLTAAGARAPEVLGVAGDTLVMEWLPPEPPSPAGWRACGETLRSAHSSCGDGYGWEADHAFGDVAIPNTPVPDWPGFWAERRLLPSLPALPSAQAYHLEKLAADLPNRLPRHPAPSLLHGDLWTGNVHCTGGGAALIDPACYYGHAEVDLAMLDLFGRIPTPFLEGYGRAEAGVAERRPLYQLWPALVHLRLFGRGYLGMVTGLLDAAGA